MINFKKIENKFKLNKYGKQRFIKVLAGITVVSISPLLASTVSENTPDFKIVMSEAAQYVEENINLSKNLVPLAMNDSALLLYKPDGENNVVTERLPPISKIISYEEDVTSGYNNRENINDISNTNEETDVSNQNNENSIESEDIENNVTEKIEASDSENINIHNDNYSNNGIAAVMSQNISNTSEDLSVFDSEDGHILSTTFTSSNGISFINLESSGQVRNETQLDNDVIFKESQKLPNIKLELNGEPEVLIMHTHTSEAYQPTERDYFDSEYNCRSLDPEKNIIAVGGEMAKSLASMGIMVIHDGTVHDNPEYSGAYARSEETVKSILAKYPSIKVVLDVHRDAIEDEYGSRIAAVTEIDEKNAAQVMIISAADDGTYDIPNYIENFKFASLLQQSMETDYPGITRPVLFQYCHYNQQLTTGSLLIEVGSHGNSLEQAKYTGDLIGKSIAEALLSLRE